MAGRRFGVWLLLHLSCAVLSGRVLASPVNIPPEDVKEQLLQSAINALNEDSPTHHKYQTANLISAQKLTEPPYTVYRLTFNLNPICEESVESCPREACTLNLKEHELGAIIVEDDSIQCMYLYPQFTQEVRPDSRSQDQEAIDNLDQQLIGNQSVELDHEVQKSTDRSDKPFIAMRASKAEYCPGCPYELNASLPGLSVFGEAIVKSMDDILNNDYKHKVVNIVKATRQIPISTNVVQYHLLLEIGETHCLKNTLVDRAECGLQANLPTKMCFVTLEEQPWQQNGRVIKSNNCTQTGSVGNEVSASIGPEALSAESTYNHRQDNGIAVNEAKYTEISQGTDDGVQSASLTDITAAPTDRQRQQVATEAPFRKIVLNRSVDDEKPGGFVDKIKEFDEFLVDFDIPTKSDNTSATEDEAPITEEITRHVRTTSSAKVPDLKDAVDGVSRERRSSESLASERDVIYQLAQKAVSTLDDIDTDSKKRAVVDVLDAKRENFGDLLYHLKISVVSTNCDEGEENVENCKGTTTEAAKICHVHVHAESSRPVESARVVKSECRDPYRDAIRVRRSKLVGSPEAKDVNDGEIKKYADLGLTKFSEISESTNEPIIVEITEASVQVVSGLLYKIKVKLGSSNCTKGTKGNCQLLEGSEIKECRITVWSQPWIDHGSPDVNISCGTQRRRKRALKGAHYNEKMLKQATDLKQRRMFERFMKDFDRSYASEKERERRFKIFRKNLKVVEELQRNERGTGQYGVTMFADLSYEEFRARHLGLRPELRSENEIPFPLAEIPDIRMPREFDWRHYNVVTAVKDQGQCGSCWAFSVTGNVEGQYAIKHKRLLSLSEQELVDCDKLDEGCEGGLPDSAYRAIENLGGLETEADYPYRARDDRCHFNRNEAKVRVVSAVNITSNETQMAQWLVQNGPIAIGINANAMQFYMGGVSHPFKFLCNPKDLDHGVLIVGYGVREYPLFHKSLPYWTIKNSWGPRWGEQGYYRVFRGDGTCGLNQMASSAVVA